MLVFSQCNLSLSLHSVLLAPINSCSLYIILISFYWAFCSCTWVVVCLLMFKHIKTNIYTSAEEEREHWPLPPVRDGGHWACLPSRRTSGTASHRSSVRLPVGRDLHPVGHRTVLPGPHRRRPWPVPRSLQQVRTGRTFDTSGPSTQCQSTPERQSKVSVLREILQQRWNCYNT